MSRLKYEIEIFFFRCFPLSDQANPFEYSSIVLHCTSCIQMACLIKGWNAVKMHYKSSLVTNFVQTCRLMTCLQYIVMIHLNVQAKLIVL